MLVYAAQPREGTETSTRQHVQPDHGRSVYAAQPREGTETSSASTAPFLPFCLGLCSSTPRGDGNCFGDRRGHDKWRELVYAAQPREGTETIKGYDILAKKKQRRFMQLNPARGRKRLKRSSGPQTSLSWFMQLNPARGRKPEETPPSPPSKITRFMQLNPARGRKLPEAPAKIPRYPCTVYAAQPREGTETRRHIPRYARRWRSVYAAQPREGTET